MRKFRELIRDMDCKVLVGIVFLKLLGMVKFMIVNVLGIFVLDE